MTAQERISGQILYLVAAGLTLKQAFDKVLGAGSFDKLADSLKARVS
jgi:hypothetical protein